MNKIASSKGRWRIMKEAADPMEDRDHGNQVEIYLKFVIGYLHLAAERDQCNATVYEVQINK